MGDWALQKPHLRPGGWAFQYANPHYPDLDDTAVIVSGMDRAQRTLETHDFQESIERAREWIEGLQSRDGGWAAFDADNTDEYLNNIPFSDHGALLDPPSPDLTGALRVDADPARREPRRTGGEGGRRLPHADAAAGRLVVRPLGRQLHLRHLVGALRAELRPASSRRPRPCAGPPPGSCRSRTGTAAGARTGTATGSTMTATSRRRARRRRRPGRCSALMAAGEADSPAVGRGVA